MGYTVSYSPWDGGDILTLPLLCQVSLVFPDHKEIPEVLEQKGIEGETEHQGLLDKGVWY